MGIISRIIITLRLLVLLLLLLILLKPPAFMENLLYASSCMSYLPACAYLCVCMKYLSHLVLPTALFSLGIVIPAV